MKERKITKERLEYLLVNWGRYATSGAPVGPQHAKHCGSAESQFARDPSRYVWEGRAYVPRETSDIDDALGIVTEQAVLTLPENQQKALLLRYGKNLTLVAIAMTQKCSLATAEATIAGATIAVWEYLESQSWQNVA